jgi:phosphate transport system permease protein
MDRRSKDLLVSRLMRLASLFSILLVVGLAFTLVEKSAPILASQPLSTLLTSSSWNPANGQFGLYAFIVGTFVVTGLTLLIACPICILTAIYLAEYAPRKVRGTVKPAVDLLAGIPSVVFGLWGILFVVPLIRNYVGEWAGVSTTGYSILAGAVVLSIMVSPILISISEEVIKAVPFRLREASMALGATKWQTTKGVVVRRALPGVLAAVVLAFGRAFGETMAVLMVVGNVAKIPTSILDPAYPLPALIANEYGEMLSIPLYGSALLFAALILFAVIAVFNILARLVLAKVEGWAY